ncbi:MAG: TonB-dependent receptor [Chitinophagaceae bacterium]|nr:TonB-dependent receptor [Chitinophagaceae bacterium]
MKKLLLLSQLTLVGFLPLQAQLGYAKTSTASAVSNQLPSEQGKDNVTLNVRNERLASVLEKIEKQTGLIFVYANDEIDVNQRVSVNVTNKPIVEVAKILLTPLGINYMMVKDKVVLQSLKPKLPLTEGSNSTNFSARPVTASDENVISISGKVSDESNMGIAGVSVLLKETTIGTTTDASGNFELNIPDDKSNGTLVFSYVGYSAREVTLQGRKILNVVLNADNKELADVIVVGYGTQKRISVTGAVDGINKKSIEGRPVTNLSTALQGISPNLIIQQRNFEPGQGVNINIRGLGTLGDNTPLVVIDGIVGGDINLLNPSDIESVSVLKDAGSAAIYGSRSANGVLLITTKRGKKNSPLKVSYSGIYGVQTPRVTYSPVHAWENAYYKNESLANSGLSPAFTPAQIQEFSARGDGDWNVNNLLHDAVQQSHNLSFSGGGENNTYMLSVGYLDQKNNFIGPDYGYRRYNIRMNQTHEYGRLKLNSILSYVKVQGKDHSFNTGTLLVDASRVPLYYSFQDTAGNYLTNPVSAQFNPKAILENGGYRNSNDDEIFGNINAELAITKDLKIRGVFGGTVRSNTSFSRRLELKFLPGGAYGNDLEVSDRNSKSLFTNLQFIAEYNKAIKNHEFTILAGTANESFKSEASQVLKTMTDPNLGVPTTGTIVSPTGSFNSIQGTTETSINSVFGRANYSYSDRYFVEFNFRYDGSSKFAKDNRWGFFPSVSAAWRMTEENFFANVKDRIGDIKVRASYGILGNQNVNAYQYQTSFFNYANAYGFNNAAVGGAGYTLGNPDLTWEKAATLNVGVDVSVLNRRLEFSFDYFNKSTTDILYQRRDVPQLFGAGFPDYNVAEVKNRGWEIKASYNIPGRLFNHVITANIADNLNELVALTSGAQEQIERKEEFELLRRVGQPITVYYGYKTDGFYQTLDDINKSPKFAGSTVTAGDLKFVDRNGDGVIDDKDKFILGNPFPRYTFGFTYNVTFKGFDFNLFVQGVGKREAMIRGEQVEPFHFGYGGTMYRHQTDYWTPTNPNATYPRLSEAGSASNTNNYRTGSDLYLFDAAYVRVKNIQLGYTLPQRISGKAKIQNVRIYFTAQNVFTLTRLNFIDPEITEFDSNSSFNAGANSARAYFLPVFYGGGIDITF